MNIQIIYGKNKTKEDMSNIFFLYTKNDIIFIGDNMVKQGIINERELPIAINIFLSVFSLKYISYIEVNSIIFS